jgi:LysR family transcriptional regulator, regulator for genes of the gallate degradation pathway
MICRNLRHLRVFLAVAELRSLTLASDRCAVSQPAVTQAIGKLERSVDGALFERSRQGFFLTERGGLLLARVRRAFEILDRAFGEISPHLRITATVAQLRALIAVHETENFTLAAARLGIAQPTVHRAVTQLEQEVARPLFERTSFGIVATRQCQTLTHAVRLAFYELDQADADLADFDGREVGRIVIGAMPLSRSVILPRALARFRAARPTLPVTVLDGPYTDLLTGLRRGEIDFLVGALRNPAPIGDVEQVPLFDDRLVIVSGRKHPLADAHDLTLERLVNYPWVVPRIGTPTRQQFNALFASLGPGTPASIIESGSILLMRELLDISDHLGCISLLQAEAEISRGHLIALDYIVDSPDRTIGLTVRHHWEPTAAQRLMLECLHSAAPRPETL